MAKRRVGYDIDNVITKTYIFALKLVNRHLGTGYTLEDCSYQTVEQSFDLPAEEVMKWFRSPDSGFPRELEPVEGARDVINRYHSVFDQYFITARGASLIKDSLEWFDKNGFLYSSERIFFKSNTPEKKAELVKGHSLELFVEDSLSNANAIAEATDIPVLLVDFGYKFNRNQPYYHSRVKIVKSWEDIGGEIKRAL